ncbi:hypothetical protein L208DRAFT_1396346, partial [Tricholoma matsutake]
MGVGISCAVITVTIISAVLVKVLSTAHSCIKRTNTTLQRLLFFIVTRYLLVVLNSIALMVAFGMVGSTLDWFPFLLFASNFHVISMGMLNARTSPAKQSGADMISLTNTRNLD